MSSLQEEQSERLDRLRSDVSEQLLGMKAELETYNSETEESIKASHEDISLQIEHTRINIKNVDDKLVTSLSEMSKRLSDESTELMANQDIFKDETDTRLGESNQLCDDRYAEMCDLMKASDHRREEYFTDFKDELKGLNLKIEEVLDSVGITIQDKLKETNNNIQSKARFQQEGKEKKCILVYLVYFIPNCNVRDNFKLRKDMIFLLFNLPLDGGRGSGGPGSES